MRKRLAILAGVFFGLIIPGVAFAQETDVTEFTSYEPLQRVIDAFAEGESISDTVQTNEDDESPLVSSLQFVVNLGWGAAFVDPVLPVVPSGLAGDDSADLESLEWVFGEPFNIIPPLHPWGTDEGVVDIDSLFEDWTAYGEDGLIDGPIIIEEPPTTVWALELAEPFDQTCASRGHVGRTWKGEGLTSTEGPFTEESLSGTYDVLADGENSRFIGLECSGGEPKIIAVRMNPDRGRAQAFGPTRVVALVRDNYVVFFSKLRFFGLDEPDIEPEFYASNPGGDIATFEPEPVDVPALLPNPYDEYNSRIDLVMDPPPEAEALAGEAGARTLLHTQTTPSAIRATGDDCPPPDDVLWAETLIGLGKLKLFGSDTSVAQGAEINEDGDAHQVWTITGNYPDGSTSELVIDRQTGQMRFKNEKCEATGTATGELIGDGATTAGPEEGGEPTEEEPADSEAAPEPEPISEGDSGAPWGMIAFAIVAVALATTAIVVGRNRTRARVKDCKPLEEAWAAAAAATKQAKKTLDHWQGERDHFNDLQSDGASAGDPLPEPNRELGYPDTDDGQATYERDLLYWQQRTADAHSELTEFNREKFEEADSNRDEAQVAFDAAADTEWRALIALQNCRGEAAAAPPPVPVAKPPVPPVEEPTDPEPEGCKEGETREVEDESVAPKDFVIASAVKLRLPTAAWGRFAPNGVADPTALCNLTKAEIDAMVSDIDKGSTASKSMGRNPRPDATISLTRVTVRCVKIERCDGTGIWVDTGKRRSKRTSEPAGSVEGPSGGEMGAAMMAGHIEYKLKTFLEPYIKKQKELDEYTCD